MNIPSQEKASEQLLSSAQVFADTVVKYGASFFGTEFHSNRAEYLSTGIIGNKKVFISILFTGTVYGEYVLAIEEEVAAKILGKTTQNISDIEFEKLRSEIIDAYREFLNTVVGETITDLGKNFEKLTITSPRVYFGSVIYPKIKTSKATVTTQFGTMDCFLYVDHMGLDINSSYKEALHSLTDAHKELIQAMDKLQDQQSFLVQSEKMAALGTMAAGVAHEINTPLATVSIRGEQLKEMVMDGEVELNKELFLKNLNTIENTIAHISRITNGLRGFATGLKEGRIKSISISDLIKDTFVFCEFGLKSKGITLTCENIAADLFVECRPTQLSQLLISLINNAADAAEVLKDKWVKVSVENFGDEIQIRVVDSGAGIPEAISKKIFDPFYTTKDIGKGTGLGLSLAQGIAVEHGGKIFVDDKSPNTCFVVQLPKRQQKKAA